MAVILRYSAEFDSFAGKLHQSVCSTKNLVSSSGDVLLRYSQWLLRTNASSRGSPLSKAIIWPLLRDYRQHGSVDLV